jgi:hypothetical protein
VRAHPKKKVRHKAPLEHKAKALPKVAQQSFVPARLRGAQAGETGGALDVGSLLIVTSLALAIACFAIAVIPARAVRWRPAAVFVSERHVDLTVLGFALFMAAALTLFWTRGP